MPTDVARHWRHPAFRLGARDMAEVSLAIAAWGLVTGVAMIESGMPLPLAVAMSVLVYAGSAQLAALPLITGGAPLWVVLAAAACVNLRFVVFSAGWRAYFADRPQAERARLAYFAADLNFFVFTKRFPDRQPAPEHLPYFWGGVLVNWGSWQASSLLGIALAGSVPTAWGIGFAGTLALLAFTCSMLGDRNTWASAAVAGCAAVAAYALPLKLNLIVAIAAAVAIGLLLDHAAPAAARARR
jgi:predicted branched-subunit amino acid permease